MRDSIHFPAPSVVGADRVHFGISDMARSRGEKSPYGLLVRRDYLKTYAD
jgi:hypothetical protein